MAKKIGLFSEDDAKKIARLFRQVEREPRGNKPRHRRRVTTGGSGGSGGEPGDCDPCDPFWNSLDVTDIAAGDQVVIVRNGCVMVVDVDPCGTGTPTQPPGGGPQPIQIRDGLYEEFIN